MSQPDAIVEADDEPSQHTVHIAPGFNADATRALLPGDRGFVMTDSLSCGPLLPLSDPAEWRTRRVAFWRAVSHATDDELFEDIMGDPAGLASARQVVIWLGTSLDCQLALAFLVRLLATSGATPDRVSVIQFWHNDRGVEIRDLGTLDEGGLAAHPPALPLVEEDRDELDRTWDAVTASDPEALGALLGGTPHWMPLCRRAIKALGLRYPDRRAGINELEQRILRWVQRTPPKAARVIGCVLGEVYGASSESGGGLDMCGDAWVFHRILRLGDSSLPEPAIEISGSRSQYRHTTLKLTGFGERLLAGKANFVETNGIDDWVGGVHLQSSTGRLWFYEGGKLVRG